MVDDEDIDAMFKQITDNLEINPAPVAGIPVATLSDSQLIREWVRVKNLLNERGELLQPTTDVGNDLHAEYHGYLLEMKKRKMK